jgi:hypothetical protein
MLLSATTFQDLHEQLPSLNAVVPPHPEPRGDTPEIYSIARLLGTMPLRDSDFPLQLAKTERPDFALQLGVRSIGIEHTEAVAENAAHERKLRAGQPGKDVYLIQPARVGEPRKSRKVLQDEIDRNRMPPPMMGDSVERNWADAMEYFISKKVASAQKPGYAVHDEQWLVVYDNWQGFALERQHALALLQGHLAACDPFATFARVFILTGALLVELARSGLLLHRMDRRRPLRAPVGAP